MPILNYTTKIQPEKTVSEIQARLVKNGSRQMSFQYNDDGTLEALTFQIVIDSIPVYFSLTPDFEGVLTAMEKDKVAKNLLTKEQAWKSRLLRLPQFPTRLLLRLSGSCASTTESLSLPYLLTLALATPLRQKTGFLLRPVLLTISLAKASPRQ